MKSAGSDREYWNSKKNHWRRTIWNEILSRTDGREKTQPILYLAGPNDYDRIVATDKGVPGQNLIAIDRDKQNVARVRSSRRPALHATARDVLWNWPAARPVAAVFLDFCGGLTRENLNVLPFFFRDPFACSTIAINFLRGRDAFSNDIRNMVKLWNPDFGFLREAGFSDADTAHRGYQFVIFHSFYLVSDILKKASLNPSFVKSVMQAADKDLDEWFKGVVLGLWGVMCPRFYSYRSGSLVFDSIVFDSPAKPGGPYERDELISTDYPTDQGVSRRIAAMLAVRTMRMAQ